MNTIHAATIRLPNFAVLTLLVISAAAQAATLQLPTGTTLEISDAQFTEWIGGPLCGATATGFDPSLPESVTLDQQTVDGQCAGSVTTSSSPVPKIDMQLDVSGGLGGQASARIVYSFAIVPLAADVPMDQPVWVTANMVGEASVTSTREGSYNGAGFFFQLPDPIGQPESYFRNYTGEVCEDGDDSNGAGCIIDGDLVGVNGVRPGFSGIGRS